MPLLFNGGFEQGFIADGFDWELRDEGPSKAGALIEQPALGERGRVLQVEFTGRPVAQPLVRQSSAEPVETFAVNVMGTVNLLEAVRRTPGVTAVVTVTTDKCYANRASVSPYRANGARGGQVSVSISYAFAYATPLGDLIALVSAGSLATPVLTASSSMRLE